MLITNDERRAFMRLPVNCKVIFKRSGTHGQGRGVNLSGNGIMFLTEEPLSVGTEFELNVLPTLPSLAPLSAMVEIVRAEPGAHATEFVVAGKIQTILG